MNQAQQLLHALETTTRDWTELLIEADERGDAYEQDYENELTWFEMPDGSVALFNGACQDIRTYGCKE